ncbi:hypothetical protein APHAL10511_004241 [Amanita phalloides]|nr:hypothetical protein APHAL10511_004241 [Amanita phalloides]
MHITGKIMTMINHLLSCIRAPEEVKTKMKTLKGKEAIEDEDNEADGDKGQLTVGKHAGAMGPDTSTGAKQRKFTVVAAKALSFNNEKQVGFEDQLLRAFILAGWLFNSIMDLEV